MQAKKKVHNLELIQTSEQTEKMDELTALVYEMYENDKQQLIGAIQGFLLENGQSLVNMRDSSGNRLIHNICMALTDEDSQLLGKILLFLLKPAQEDTDAIAIQACQNFIAGMSEEMQSQFKQSMIDLDIEASPSESLTQITKLNPGNAFGQTPLHLLASQKKTVLLKTYLKHLYNQDQQVPLSLALVGFDPNKPESTNRSFMHILLDKRDLETFEEISKSYQDVLNLKSRDRFQNNALMVYKVLKREQLSKLKEQQNYEEFVRKIASAEIMAFGDIRNLVFDREIGTNILTELTTTNHAQQMLELSQDVKKILGQDMIEQLANVTDAEGTNIWMRLINKFPYSEILKFQEVCQEPRVTENTLKKLNFAHYILSNRLLDSDQKLELLKRFTKESDFNGFDLYGNLPLNLFIEGFNFQILGINDLNLLKFIVSKTDLTIFTDSSKQEQLKAEVQQQLANLDQMRKDCNKKDDTLKTVKIHKIQETLGKSSIRQRIQQKLKAKKDLQKEAIAIPVNPLEISIKSGQIELTKFLINECGLDPLSNTSEGVRGGEQTLIELAQNDEILQAIIKEVKQKAKDLGTIINIYNRITEYHLNEDRGIFISLIEKLLPNDTFTLRDMILSHLRGDETSIELDQSTDLKALFSETRTYSSFHTSKHLCQLMLICVRLSFYELLALLFPHLVVSADVTYFHYRLLKERALRNDSKGIKTLATLFPDLPLCLKQETYLYKMSTSMFLSYRDIIDTDAAEALYRSFGVAIAPRFTSTNAYRVMDREWMRLSGPKQQEKVREQEEKAFAMVARILVEAKRKGEDVPKHINEAVDKYLFGRNRGPFIEKLVENGAVFDIIDIRREAQQQAVGQQVIQMLKSEKFKEGISLMKQLKEYIQAKCSIYPINYHAELAQFERNYPYRDFRMSDFIRKMNLKEDKYPMYLGQLENGLLDDDQEDYLQTVWEEMLSNNTPVEAGNYPGIQDFSRNQGKDIFVPNANVLIFKMFASILPVQLVLTLENYQALKELFILSIEFGGFPMLEIANFKTFQSQSDYSDLLKLNKLLKNFNASIKAGNYQSILHQLVFIPDIDQRIIQALSSDDSIQRENFNCKDKDGKTPVTIAIEHGNFTFLDQIAVSKHLFIKDDEYLSNVIQRVFETSKNVEDKIKILRFIALNINSLQGVHLDLQLKSCRQSIGEIIDLLYAAKDENENSTFLPKSAKAIWKTLGTNFDVFITFNRQILETYKLMRAFFNSIQNPHQAVLFGKMISITFQLGKMITQIASEATLAQIQELESLGLNISNIIAPTFTATKFYAGSLPQHFPFENPKYYLSFALKYALLKQPDNRALIDYLNQKMTEPHWKPFLFEIQLLIGHSYTTKDPLFESLFTVEQSYMMGKHLTVESRLRQFKDQRIPLPVTLYYTEQAYNKLLLTNADQLIVNNSYKHFLTFINQQARFYLNDQWLIQTLESAIRHYRPRMALIVMAILLRQNQDEFKKLLEYGNINGDPNQEDMTWRDMCETKMIVRSISTAGQAKGGISLSKLSRDLVDYLLSYLMEHDELKLLLNNIADNESKKSNVTLLTELFIKSSSSLTNQFLTQLYSNLTSEQERHSLTKFLFQIPRYSQLPPSMMNMSQNHRKQTRPRQVVDYLMSKAAVFAQSEAYCEILKEKSNDELAQKWQISIEQVNRIKQRVQEVRQEWIKKESQIYSKAQVTEGCNNVKTMREQDFSQMKSREEVIEKTGSEEAVRLWEAHKRDERRKASVRRDNRDQADLEDKSVRSKLRDKQEGFNMDAFFTDSDTSIIIHPLEEFFFEEKLTILQKHVQPIVDAASLKDLLKYQSFLTSPPYLPYSSKTDQHNDYIFPLYVQLHKRLFPLLIEKIQSIPKEEEKKENDDDYGEEDDDSEDLRNLMRSWSFIAEHLRKMIKEGRRQDDIAQAANQILGTEFADLMKLKMSQDYYKDYIHDLVGLFLLDPQLYHELRSTFFRPVIESISTDFAYIFEQQEQPWMVNRLRAFCFVVALPVFNNSEEFELKKLLLENELFTEKAPTLIKQLMFVIMATSGRFDDILIELGPYLKEITDLEDIAQQQSLRNIMRTNDRDTLTCRFPSTVSRNPLIYLIKCGRFKVFSAYLEQEIYPSSSDILLPLLKALDPAKPENIDLLNSQLPLLIEQQTETHLLLPHLLDLASAIYEILILQLNPVSLYLEHQNQHNLTVTQDSPSTQLKCSLLHDLIFAKRYSAITRLNTLCTPDQWIEFSDARVKWNEEADPEAANAGHNNEEDEEEEEGKEVAEDNEAGKEENLKEENPKDEEYRPMFLAIVQQAYSSAREMKVEGELSKREFMMLQKYIEEVPIHGFAMQAALTKDEQKLLMKVEEELQSKHLSYGSDNDGHYNFGLVKKILIFPEILDFINSEQKFGDQDLKQVAQKVAEKDRGLNIYADIFLSKIGLNIFTSKVLFTSYTEEEALLAFEHGAFDLSGYLNITPTDELFLKPFTQLYPSAVQHHDPLAQDFNYPRDNTFLESLFTDFNTHIETLIAKRAFRFLYFLLKLQIAHHPYPGKLDAKDVCLESFEEDLVMIDLLIQEADDEKEKFQEINGGQESRRIAKMMAYYRFGIIEQGKFEDDIITFIKSNQDQKHEKELFQLSRSLNTVKEALQLYDQAFHPSHSRLSSLCTSLNHSPSSFSLSDPQLADFELFESLLAFATSEPHVDQFNFHLTLTDPVPLQTDSSLHPLSLGLCEFIVNKAIPFLLTLQSAFKAETNQHVVFGYNQLKTDVYLSIDTHSEGQPEIETSDEGHISAVKLSLRNDLITDSKARDIAHEMSLKYVNKP